MNVDEQKPESRLEETKRVARILRIVQLLGILPRAWTRRRLALEFELSERMIDKDLELIRNGLRYDVRRAREGYYIVGGPHLKPVDLSIPEALALALAAQQARETGTADPAIIAGALARLEAALPAGIVPYLRRAGDAASGPFGPLRERGSTLATLERAMAEGRAVDMAYRSASRGDALSERRIHPYRLVPYDNSWQIIAHDGPRQTVRMFKVHRVERCVLTDERYEVPAHFDVDAYLGDTWGVLRGEGGQAEDISLVFTPTAAAWVRDERRHSSQTTEPLPDGGIRLRFHATVTHELVRWVLSFGGDVTVEQPEALRNEVVEAAAAVLRVANAPGHPIS